MGAMAIPMLAAGGTAAGAGAAGVSAGTILAGTVSAFGAMQTLRAGEAERANLSMQATIEDARARRERIRGEQEANEIRARLNRTLAQNVAASFASGLNIDSGSVQQGMTQAQAQAQRQLNVNRSNTEMNVFASNLQARQLRMQARAARTGAGMEAAFGLLGTAERMVSRGRVPQQGDS